MSDEQREKIRTALKARGLSPTKDCSQCRRILDRTEFGVRKNGHSRSACKACEALYMRERAPETQAQRRRQSWKTNLRRHYGLTVTQYNEMVVAQLGVCAICGEPERGRLGNLYVDHCHKTGVIRGLLCQACNNGIGGLRDDPERIRKAAAYVEAHRPGALVAVPYRGGLKYRPHHDPGPVQL